MNDNESLLYVLFMSSVLSAIVTEDWKAPAAVWFVGWLFWATPRALNAYEHRGDEKDEASNG